MKNWIAFALVTISVNAMASQTDADKSFNKALSRLKRAHKLQTCLPEAKAYAASLRASEDHPEALDECLKQAKRLERITKAGF